MGSRSETNIDSRPPTPPVRGRLVQGMLLLSGGEMAAKLFCFFAFTRIGRLLGPERYGSLEFVLALIVFFTLPADCGLGSYGAREIARGRFPVPRLLAGIATLRLLLALGSFAVLMATVLALPAPVRSPAVDLRARLPAGADAAPVALPGPRAGCSGWRRPPSSVMASSPD